MIIEAARFDVCGCLFWRVFSYVNGADFFFFFKDPAILINLMTVSFESLFKAITLMIF